MAIVPSSVVLDCIITAQSFEDAVNRFFAAFTQAGMPAIERWSIPSEGARKSGTAEDALSVLANIAKDAPANPAPVNGIFEMEGDVLLGIWHDHGDRYHLDTRKQIGSARYDEMLEFISRATEVCRFLLQQGYLLDAALIRDDGGLSSSPDVPLVHSVSHVTVVTEQQVRDAYDNPEAFWQAGWDVIESLGEQHFLVRGIDVLEGPDYLARILPHQWAMARAAKPGLTKYYLPQVEPEEWEIYHAGSATLGIVGYLAGEKLVEFTCALEPGQHINGWEIFDLWDLLQAGELPDGRKVEVIRVVFLECATARQEKRPLLDIGAKVFCYNDAGDLIELSD